MTAEIAILNKSAVALAADSAVTIRGPKGEKIYNTANKLFNLSKYHPVGIMIYGNAAFMDIPWETIIKSYRTSIVRNNLKNTILEQAEDFVTFLKSDKRIFSDKFVESYKINKIKYILNWIKYNIEEIVKSKLALKKKFDLLELFDIELDSQKNSLKRFKYHNNYSDLSIKDFYKTNNRLFLKLYKEILQEIPFSKQNRMDIFEITFMMLYKNQDIDPKMSGVVITGFGNDEYLPSLVDYEFFYLLDGELIYKLVSHTKDVNGSLIQPYAQPDMVHTFIQGINPTLFKSSFSTLKKIFDKISNDFKDIPEIKRLRKNTKNNLTERLKKLHQDNLKSFADELNNIIKFKFIDPVVYSISSLPKEELAAAAESLVYLTFLRKRMTDELETVGGDIDVAVISKGDGFIWIKRKHYFKPELNPHFFKNYFK